jgi:hypothetical protein
MSDDDGPPIFRPIPRRPFDLSLTSPTPPEEDSAPPSPIPDFQPPRFLTAQSSSSLSGPTDSGSLSRAQSIINLTASTLFGIFSPTSDGKDRYYGPGEEPDTPWGTGAQTPIKRPSVDEPALELMKDHSSLIRRRSSLRPAQKTPQASTTSLIVSLGLRAALLFLLGVGYGALVTRLRTEQDLASFSVEEILHQGYSWKYMAFWGVSGVGLGVLLPWFDRVWEDSFGSGTDEVVTGHETSGQEPSPGTDWALVVRGVGAFMGIVFAIVRAYT